MYIQMSTITRHPQFHFSVVHLHPCNVETSSRFVDYSIYHIYIIYICMCVCDSYWSRWKFPLLILIPASGGLETSSWLKARIFFATGSEDVHPCNDTGCRGNPHFHGTLPSHHLRPLPLTIPSCFCSQLAKGWIFWRITCTWSIEFSLPLAQLPRGKWSLWTG
jgi:hypothetical protein